MKESYSGEMQTGYVISDLHVFASWSWVGKHLDRMHEAAEGADFFVLNGDIFDFRWSTLGGAEATLGAAVEWLDRFAAAHPGCRVYYVLGNHDGFAGLAHRMEGLARERENFEWRPASLRMGSVLFAHGDLFCMEGQNPFERPMAAGGRRFGGPLSWLYHGIHTIHGTWVVHRRFTPLWLARIIVRSLAGAPSELAAGITDVYCGHTHVAFSDFVYQGLTIHNTGSGIKHLNCNLCKVSIPEEGDLRQ